MTEIEQEEYDICKRRGHEPGDSGVTQGSWTWQWCIWCHTQYRWETIRTMVEA